MAEPDDSDSLPTQPWSFPDGAASATPGFSDSAFDGMLGANSPATRGGWQPPTPEELQVRLPQYEIAALLGRGGMGAVYKGWQRSLSARRLEGHRHADGGAVNRLTFISRPAIY